MSEHVDEPVDDDLLLAFATEPGGAKPQESDELLKTRVDRLEQELDQSKRQVESLKSEMATLVSATGDIHKRSTPRPESKQLNVGAALAGVVLGIALGLLGWTMWSRESIDAIAVAQAQTPVAAPVPLTIESPPQPTVARVAATSAPAPAPARDLPERAVAADLPEPAQLEYVGTLSIDAAPGGQVFINRKAAGVTPLRVKNLKAGSHLVWIERDGYRRFTRVVQVPADRVSRLWADLEPLAPR